MGKIFGYELRRLLGNKFSAGLAVLTLAYSYWVMNEEVILGIANTAPFSPWSFGVYLGRVMPVLSAALLFFLSFYHSPEAERVRPLFDAAMTAPGAYRAACCGACAAAFGVMALIPVLYAGIFYGAVFGFTGFGSLLGPLAVAVLPPFLLLLGGGMLAGRVHRGCLFALIPLVLLLAVWTPSEALDLFGTAFFAGYPASLSVLDPGFSLPAGQAAGRALVSLAGMAMAVFSFRQAGRKKAA